MPPPVDIIYNQRKDFIIVALTDITGSRCFVFAETMVISFGKWCTLCAIVETFYKLNQPFMQYKDELAMWEKMR